MATRKPATVFVCASCGQESSRWLGRCPACGLWNTFHEETARPRGASPGTPRGRSAAIAAVPLASIPATASARIATGSAELDTVLGGGLVPGATVLVGGEPGIGKSTLLLQTAAAVASRGAGVLYVSAEESPAQLVLRANRLGIDAGRVDVLASGALENILEAARAKPPVLLILDSIQAIHGETLTSTPGTVSQIRECTWLVTEFCRERGIALVLAGHVTKDGGIAGPKTLEHMVDAVLYFEGPRDRELRIVRSVKNRFGNVNGIAVFMMGDRGLAEVTDPGGLFIEGIEPPGPGSVLTAALEGNRVLVAEIQALVTARAAGSIARTTDGVDANRVQRVRAILESSLGLDLADRDTFVNVTGGLDINEPAVELAIAAAIRSSLTGKAPSGRVLVIGELGLRGDLRRVAQADKRVQQARKLGLSSVVLPEANRPDIAQTSGIDVVFAANIAGAFSRIFC